VRESESEKVHNDSIVQDELQSCVVNLLDIRRIADYQLLYTQSHNHTITQSHNRTITQSHNQSDFNLFKRS
jgi:hypothetical protein